ncbi:hypothetical protein CTI14_72010, partial [Methylobacterium radiotolerans]
HRRQYLDVIDAIRTGRRPAITTDDGRRRQLRVVLASHRRQYLDVIDAIRTGRRPAITTDDGRRRQLRV